MQAVKRHLWWAIGTFILILAVTLAIFVILPKRYTASAKVWLGDTHGQLVAGQPDSLLQTDPTSLRDRELRILASPDMVGRVAVRPGLVSRLAVSTLLDNITVSPVGGTFAAVVSYSDADPAMAAEVTNQLAAQYVADRRETGARAHRLRLLRASAAAARDEMIGAQTAASAYRAAASPTDDDDLQRLQHDAAASDGRLAGLRSREPATGEVKPGAKPSLAGLYARLAQLNADRTKLQKRYGPLHPDMIAMNARVAALIDEITAETRRFDRAADAARLAHQRLDAAMAARVRRQERQVFLDATATAAAARYDQSAQDISRVESLPPAPGDAHVLAPARIPSTPTSPDPWTVGAAGLVMALLGAGSAVGIRELSGPGLRTRQAAERKLGIPVIGMVPEMADVAGPAPSRTNLADLILSNAAPDFVAAFRTINAGLGIGRGGNGPRSIVVSSAFEAEGKTMVAIGIARSAALAGLRVLLVDCDVRRPAASQALAADARAGLADVLTGKVDLAQALVRDTPSGAWVLASRPGMMANGLVGSEAMRDLIGRAVADYDLVLLDTAPVLALVETRTVAAFADRVLLVARWRTTPVGATRTALSLLNEAESRVAGLALTRVVS